MNTPDSILTLHANQSKNSLTEETVFISSTKSSHIMTQRLQLFHQQEQAIQSFYQNNQLNQCLFYVASKKLQFVETQKMQTAQYLNIREVTELEPLSYLFNSLHVIDDLISALVTMMPTQRPVGWQVLSQQLNLLNLPTVGNIHPPNEVRKVEQSLVATVLQFFGVASYTFDRGYFIGHILGYLFCCYYFAHLGVNYAIIPLSKEIIPEYTYQSINVPQLVRMLQELDKDLKTLVYQLAIYCAQISEYAIDKQIEKMLIAEVNSFNKQALRDELSEQLLYGGFYQVPLFQPLKPLK